MKVISLEIHEFRGIRHLSLALNGKNTSVYGPNGSGKSGVVDALDFLLTGKITRLTGEGTFGCTLKEHGKHIDADIKDSYVKGVLHFEDNSQDVEVVRFVKNPNELIYDEKYKEIVEPIVKMAARGHYVLARKNLLNYIVAKSGERGKAIQGLLNLRDIEETRAALVKNQNDREKDFKNANSALKQSENDLSSQCGLKSFSEGLVLEYINKLRTSLGGNPIEINSLTLLLDGIALPESSSGETSINITTVLNDHRVLSGLFSAISQKEIQQSIESYLLSAKSFLDDPKYRRLVNMQNFVEKGIELIGDTGNCPLCETEWAPGELLTFLNEKLVQSKHYSHQYNEVKTKGEAIISRLTQVLTPIQNLVNKVGYLSDDKTFIDLLSNWKQKITQTIYVVSKPFELENLMVLTTVLDFNWILPEYIPDLLEKIKNILESKKSQKTPEQIAWDTLNQLKSLVFNWEKASFRANERKVILERSRIILSTFIESRDAVLKDLFDSITDRFVSLYQKLHKDDEKNFSASIELTETGVDFSVDFYGRGKQPPQALHSEGHQDSMGICLYLALAEKLTEGIFNLIVLDDVVMSVDAEHRRQFSKLLREEFTKLQFVITTHDRVWATQLRNDAVISKENSFEFCEWSIDLGPSVFNEDSEKWEQIEELALSNKVSEASSTLRRSAEQFCADVCENLQGKVAYRSDNQRALSELSIAVIGKYKKLLKQNKNACQSWQDEAGFQMVTRLEEEFDLICNEKRMEEWAINPTTHFNEWASLSSNDFLPIINVFKRFYNVFKCPVCGSIIRLITYDNREVSLCCTCKHINLNLESKPKEV